MFFKTFSLAAIFAATQAVSIKSTQDYQFFKNLGDDVISKYDSDGDGSLYFYELVNAYYGEGGQNWDELIAIWEAADLNDDYSIDVCELIRLFKKLAAGESLLPKKEYQWLLDSYDFDRS